MGISSNLFSWLHRSKFYKQFHEEAVTYLPEGKGGIWLDIGCGPGVLSRIAFRRGYNVIGLDYDLDMLEKARNWKSENTLNNHDTYSLEYKKFDIFNSMDLMLSDFSKSDVRGRIVSASSFLPVFENKKEVLSRLLNFVDSGGCLLLIETNFNCTFWEAIKIFLKDPSFSELGILLLGLVRRGQSESIKEIKHFFNNKSMVHHKLSNGIVDIFLIRNDT